MSAFEIQKYWMKCLFVLEQGLSIDAPKSPQILRGTFSVIYKLILCSYKKIGILIFSMMGFLVSGSQPVGCDIFGDQKNLSHGSTMTIGKCRYLHTICNNNQITVIIL